MRELQDFYEWQWLGSSLVDWGIALAITLIALTILLALRRLVRAYHSRMQSTAEKELLEIPLKVLSRTTSLLLIILALFAGSQWLTLGTRIQQLLASAVTIALFWQVGIWLAAASSIWLERKRQLSLETDRAAAGSLGIIGFVLKVAIWAMVLLLTLDNLGIDITALIAGLGIGGIAVALAVQNILGDLFASLSITLDRPFVVGDFLILDDYLGTVEYIGIKSTRLRSLSGEQIVISNGDLLSSRVRNYGRMYERRVVFGTKVTYQTSPEQLERIPKIIRQIIESLPDTRFDRSHFAKHGEGTLDFETVYYVLSPDYNRYMDIQQAINLQLHRKLAELGVKLAYPTRQVFVRQDPYDAPYRETPRAQQAAAG